MQPINKLKDLLFRISGGRHDEGRLSNAMVFHFCQQLANLLSAGVTPSASLKIMLDDADNKELSEVLKNMQETVSAGGRLSEAAEKSGMFPAYVTELLVVGEQTGKLENVTESLARYYEDLDDLGESVRSAVSYPVMMIVMMFVIVIVLLSRVMPIFSQVFSQLGTSVGAVTQMLMNISSALGRYYTVMIVLFVLFILFYLYIYYTANGRKLFSRFLERFPATKDFSERMAVGRFASGMQLTYEAGLDTYYSLDLVSNIVENETVLHKIEKCRKMLDEGEGLADALMKVQMFTGFYSSMLTIAAKSGNVDKALGFIAEHYRQDTDRRINRLLSAIEPTMVIILSVIIGLILLSVILPLMGVMASIG